MEDPACSCQLGVDPPSSVKQRLLILTDSSAITRSQGVDLVRAEYIPDDKPDIIATVLRLKERVGENGVIFSSGGIGRSAEPCTQERKEASAISFFKTFSEFLSLKVINSSRRVGLLYATQISLHNEQYSSL